MTLFRSWVESANSADTPFPLNNLPYGAFASGPDTMPRCGVAIGDMIFDLCKAEGDGLVDLGSEPVFNTPYWNEVMDHGPEAWVALRARLSELLADGTEATPEYIVAQADVTMWMPFKVAEFG